MGYVPPLSFFMMTFVMCRREVWRKEVDSRIALMKVTNAERSALVRDNNTLRTTVECGRQVTCISYCISLISYSQ